MTAHYLDPYEAKKRQLVADFLEAKKSGAGIGLAKKSSNLFRDRHQKQTRKINVRNFNEVIQIDSENLIAEVEGMTPYEVLVEETLKHGLLPTVVPELKSITIGGATTGIGIESSSFKYGFVHETIEEMEILLADGHTVICTRDNEYQDLFFGFPNSYGTLGYVLKLKVKLVRAKKYIKLVHTCYDNAKEYFEALAKLCEQARKATPFREARATSGAGSKQIDDDFCQPGCEKRGNRKSQAHAQKNHPPNQATPDYIDGVFFSEKEMYIMQGFFTDEAPFTSDYTFMNIYYQSIRHKKIDYLTTRDYIWRWDTDWFWCSYRLMMQNRVARFMLGKFMLGSKRFWKIFTWANRHQLIQKQERMRGVRSENIIQDVEIPIENAEKFLDFYTKHIVIRPVWICPVQTFTPSVQSYHAADLPNVQPDAKPHVSRLKIASDSHHQHLIDTPEYPLYKTDPHKLYINFGFWDAQLTTHEDGYYNRLIEAEVETLHGKKSLYSDSYYSEEKFGKLYNKPDYDRLKKKYDPAGRFKNLYEKCVKRR